MRNKETYNKKKFLIISNYAYSLINVRSHLLLRIKDKGIHVGALAPACTENLQNRINKIVDRYIRLRINRSSMNPLSEMVTLFNIILAIFEYKPKNILAVTIKPIVWSGVASNFFNLRFTALITGLGYAFHDSGNMRSVLKYITIYLYRLSLKNAHSVIFQNADNMNKFIDLNIVKPQVCCLVEGSGVDLNHFEFSKLPKTKEIIFLCIARLMSEKGVREYAAAAKHISKTKENIKFVLLGSVYNGPDAIDLKEVGSWISDGFITHIDHTTDVRPYIRSSHVFVLPSYHEGIPRSTLEAMSMGRPIITTDAVGCKETVIDGVNGKLIPVKSTNMLIDSMIWCTENRDKLDLMGIESRRIARERFDIELINEQMIKAINLC